VLSYRLLRYANSAYCGLRSEVTSIHHALVLVGVDRVRQWALLLMMSQMADGKPAELFTVAMVRAQMCASLGGAHPDHSSGEYFMVGLLSVLDALMDQPMDVVLSELPLSTASKHALIKQVGPLGETLSNVLRYERGEDPEDDEETFTGAYLSAICWSNEVLHGLAA
jgi:EAL and modified HD-GYP domain-containing signal transduction protein